MLSAYDRVKLAVRRRFGQIPRILIQHRGLRRLRRCSAHARIVLRLCHVLAHRAEYIDIYLLHIDIHRMKELACHAAALPDDRYEDMLRPDHGRLEAHSLAIAALDDLLSHRRIYLIVLYRDVHVRRYQLIYQVYYLFLCHTVCRQHLCSHSRALLYQTQQQMLRADICMCEILGSLYSQIDGLLGLSCESVCHI